MTSATTEESAMFSEGGSRLGRFVLNFVRIVLGLIAAVLAPGMLVAFLLVFAEASDLLKNYDATAFRLGAEMGFHATYVLAVVAGLVTLPTALLLGLPIGLLFLFKGWHGWRHHAAAGAAVGFAVGYLLLSYLFTHAQAGGGGGALSASLGGSAICAVLGVLSATLYWVTVYARYLVLRLAVGLGSLSFLVLFVLYFFSLRADMFERMNS